MLLIGGRYHAPAQNMDISGRANRQAVFCRRRILHTPAGHQKRAPRCLSGVEALVPVAEVVLGVGRVIKVYVTWRTAGFMRSDKGLGTGK